MHGSGAYSNLRPLLCKNYLANFSEQNFTNKAFQHQNSVQMPFKCFKFSRIRLSLLQMFCEILAAITTKQNVSKKGTKIKRNNLATLAWESKLS